MKSTLNIISTILLITSTIIFSMDNVALQEINHAIITTPNNSPLNSPRSLKKSSNAIPQLSEEQRREQIRKNFAPFAKELAEADAAQQAIQFLNNSFSSLPETIYSDNPKNQKTNPLASDDLYTINVIYSDGSQRTEIIDPTETDKPLNHLSSKTQRSSDILTQETSNTMPNLPTPPNSNKTPLSKTIQEKNNNANDGQKTWSQQHPIVIKITSLGISIATMVTILYYLDLLPQNFMQKLNQYLPKFSTQA